MYYNIKIKASDSEFSLESQNKSIIEHEMDAYFAYFFDASYEFKSKIKPVELTSDSLVSIDEIDNPNSSYKQEEDIEYYESSEDFDEQTPLEEEQPIQEQNPIEEIIEDQNTQDSEITQESEQFSQEAEQNPEEAGQFSQEIEQNHQESETIQENFEDNNFTEEIYTQEQNEEENSQENIKENEEQESIEQVVEEHLPEENVCNQSLEEVTEEEGTDFSKDGSVENIKEDLEEILFKNEPAFAQEPAEQTSEVFIPDIIIDEPEAATAPVIEEEIVKEPTVQEEIKQEEIKPEPTKPQAPKLEFKFFLAGFIISDIFNQFMACAYYMKNVLKQNCFNMKTINSHLIKATGNIADMSVVFELMQKEYIDSKEINDSTVYFITPLGEEYFIKKYQE